LSNTSIFIFWNGNWKTKDSESTDSSYSLTSICSQFLPEENFDLFKLFQNIFNAPPYQNFIT